MDGPFLEDLKFLFGEARVQDLQQDDCWEYDETQLFEDHDTLHRRLGKSLYYGGSESTSVDSLSFPLTQICVDHFNSVITESASNEQDIAADSEDDFESEDEAGADTSESTASCSTNDEVKREKRLDMARASAVARDTCSSPTSLVVALIYLERLRVSNPRYLGTVASSADLFLVSLMVASKYLHDDGEEDEVFNDEWATSGGLTKRQLNDLEIDFLISIDWRLHVTPDEFEGMASTIEQAVAKKQIDKRNWKALTYTDLQVLSQPLAWSSQVWDTFLGLTLRVTTVVVAAYAASLVSMLATCHLLNQIKLGPNAITHSAHTLYNTAVTGRGSGGGNRNVAQSVAAPNASDLRVAGLEGGEAGDATINLTALNETDCNLLPPHSCNQEMPSAPSPLVMNKEICSDHYKLKDPDHHLGNNFLSDWRLKLAGFPLDPDKHKLHLEQQLFHPGFATSIETIVH